MHILSKISNWYFTKSALPYWAVLCLDCFMVSISMMFVYVLFNDAVTTLNVVWRLLFTIAFYLLFYIVSFRIYHTYAGVIRYTSFDDLIRIVLACLTAVLMIFCARLFVPHYDYLLPISNQLLLVSAILAALAMGVGRIVVKNIYDFYYNNGEAVNAFIYGVSEGGVALTRSIKTLKPKKFNLCGFVSENEDEIEKKLFGVSVYPLDKQVVNTMLKLKVSALLISPMLNERFFKNKEFQDALIKAGIKMFLLPQSQEWDGKSDISHSQLREIEIEDLLQRDKIEVDMDAVGAFLKDKTILITGAAGSIGSEMLRQIAVYSPKRLVLIDQAETPMHDVRCMMAKKWPEIETHTIVTSICKTKRLEAIFSTYKPDYVFHAAAYKHVPMMEDNPCESIQNNVHGTKIIADLAVKYGTQKFVMISTDKAVNPTNVMGCSKRICEMYVQSLDKAIKDSMVKGVTQFVTTRFGNVLGSNGSVIPIFKEQIKQGGPVTVTDPKIIRFFMLIPEACKLVLEAGTKGNGGEIFVFDMGKPVKIADLAQKMIDLSGAKNVKIEYTGLRDGEKLYEEVLNDKEITKPSFHEKIKIASVREVNYSDVNRNIEELIELSCTYDEMAVVAKMKSIVPEFKSQHSKFQALDSVN